MAELETIQDIQQVTAKIVADGKSLQQKKREMECMIARDYHMVACYKNIIAHDEHIFARDEHRINAYYGRIIAYYERIIANKELIMQMRF